jgi:DNA polymerase III delta prime subunit
MSLTTDIVGYNTIIPFLEARIKQPTHLALFGPHGSGKTILARHFIQSYFASHNIFIDASQRNSEYLMILSAEQDRGIHTVRDSLMDFVRQPATRPGLVRWIIIDDIDTFPELSQQALRRPMEMYRHVCCFFFIGTKESQLIPPILSRCQIIELPFFDINTYLILIHMGMIS